MSQVLRAFGLLDFTMLWPFSLGARFETDELFISLIFQFWGGRGKPWITETADNESVDMEAHLYFYPRKI
jgi:hypothetical protein